MAETQTVITEENKATEQFNPFVSQSWSDTKPEPQENAPVVTELKKPEEETKVETLPVIATKEEEEIIDPKEWLKREFDTDDINIIKQEREEYKKIKDKKPELEFVDEQSKTIHELIRTGKRKEVREFLETQERLDSFTTGNVTKDNAQEIIKLGMQLSNKLLTKEDIEFQYKQEYGTPKEPIQRTTETDEEFTERTEEWKEKVANIEMKKVVAAKMAVPQLEKLKQSITLPEIQKPVPTVEQPSQEYLDKVDSSRKNFLQKLDSDYAKVEGFSATVKDESVEIPVAFKIPDDAKVAIKQRLQGGLDINGYIDQRWFGEDGSPKIEQIVADIYEWENREKVHSGLSNNAASRRLEEYKKSIKNIDLNGGGNQSSFASEERKMVNPYAKEAWSEKPIVQN